MSTVLACIVLALALIAAAAAICSAHIPGLRTWTGAAPLDKDQDEEAEPATSGGAPLSGGDPLMPDGRPYTPGAAGHQCRPHHPTGAGDRAYRAAQAARHRVENQQQGDPQ